MTLLTAWKGTRNTFYSIIDILEEQEQSLIELIERENTSFTDNDLTCMRDKIAFAKLKIEECVEELQDHAEND